VFWKKDLKIKLKKMGIKEKYVEFLAMTTSSTEGVVSKEDKKVATAEDVPSSDISLCGHSILSFLFVGLVVAYTCLSIYAFVERPEVEVFSQQRISNFHPLSIDITTECSNAPNCGPAIKVVANWSGANSDNSPYAACAGADRVVAYSNTSQLSNPKFSVLGLPLCYVPDQTFTTVTTLPLAINGITVDTVLNPGEADPTLKASASITVSTSDKKLNRLVNLDTWQIKTLVLGMNVKRRDDEIVEQTLYPIAIQYEGKRPNWRATLIVALNQVANVYDVSRPGTPLDVISSIGGAAGLIGAALLFFTPVFRCLFPGEAPREVEDVEEGEEMDNNDKKSKTANNVNSKKYHQDQNVQ
jgi:hypothetical protein